MSLRRIKVKTTDGSYADGTVSGVMITWRGLSLVVLLGGVSCLAAAGYVAIRFRERGNAIGRLSLQNREQQGTVQALAKENRELQKALTEARALAGRDPGAQKRSEPVRLHLEALRASRRADHARCLELCGQILLLPDLDAELAKDVHLRQAASFQAQGQWNHALEAIRSGLRQFPDFLPLLQAKVEILLVQRRFAEALPLAETLVAKTASPAALFARGNIHWGMDHADEASRDFQSVLASQSQPFVLAAANNLALLSAEAFQDFERANFYMSLLLSLAPDGFECWSTGGRVLLLEGRLAKARVYLETAIRKNPKSLDANLNLALCLERLGDAAGAKQRLARAEEIRPDWEETYGRLKAALLSVKSPAIGKESQDPRHSDGD